MSSLAQSRPSVRDSLRLSLSTLEMIKERMLDVEEERHRPGFTSSSLCDLGQLASPLWAF